VLSRNELVHLLAQLEGTAVVEVEGETLASRIHRLVPLERALGLGILPLVRQGTRLYCLAEPLARGKKRAAPPGLELVVLGEQPALGPRLQRTWAELERRDPGKLTFPRYLHRLGLIGRALAESLSGPGTGIWRPRLREADIPEEALYAAASVFFDLPLLTPTRVLELVDASVLRRMPRSFIEASGTLPLRVEGERLWVAVTDLPETHPLELLARELGCGKLHLLVAPPGALRGALEALPEVDSHESTPAPGTTVPLIVERLLQEAVRRGCSDLHLERYEHRVDVRLRKDGALHPLKDSGVTPENVQAVVTKLKVDARLDITESRRPQDGAFRRRYDRGQVDFRVATQPTLWGENLVLRVLEQRAGVPSLEQLGFEPELLVRLRRLLLNPQGLLLVTGPTGSGKTTTLYSILEELKQPGQKLLTVEDPIEYALEGVQQSQVDEALGNTFDRLVRAFMRQDPDVILVGEIRDAETARSTLRAALTGHLILSTVHANDVFGVVRRIMDLGVEEGLLAQTLLGVLGQRLARRVCPGCTVPDEPPAERVREFFPQGLPAGARLRRGRGCEACGGTGYSGRIVLSEYWEPDEQGRRMLERGLEPSELRLAALGTGFRPLVAHATRLAAEGLIPLEELCTVVPYEQVLR
jgi:type II secretory ATPase GspE/PulE/Tfp pilus assembly ATPase PilB-like protein